ncbi:MAG: hypothetical protein AAGC71_12660 [Pseudomonadota bacterium]
MAYLSSKFRDAVVALCDAGSVKDRLADSFTQHLDDIHEDELPSGQRGLFAALRKKLHQTPALGGESPIVASVRKMSAFQAAECARCIVDLYTATIAQESSGRALHVVDGRDGAPQAAAAVPEFLLKS